MKVKILVLLIVISSFMFVSCGNTEKEKGTLESEIWKEIVNKEWSNWDVWAGDGVYFYEKENLPICAYKIYGSGVPIIDLHESEVEIIDKKIVFEVIEANDLSETNDIKKVYFTYKDGKLINNDKIYERLFIDTDTTIKFLEEYKEFTKDE